MTRSFKHDAVWVGFVAASLALVTLLSVVLQEAVASPAAAGWLYLLVVLPVTLRWGRWAGLGTVAFAGLLLLGVVAEPRRSLAADSGEDLAKVALSVGGMALAVLLLDLANRGRLAAERRLAAQEEREAAQRLALAGVAHDLNQPLTSLSVAAQLLQRGAERLSQERQAQLLSDVLRSTARLRRMMGDWLALAQGQPPPLTLAVVDPRLVVETVAEEYTARFDGRLTVEQPSSLPFIRADLPALERILGNLITNAANYGDGPVMLTAQTTDNGVQFSVLDRGPGLPAGETARLFAPFQRGAGAAARADGHGLGLAIVALLVHAHGGQVWAEQRPGGGAAFHVVLPAAVPSSGAQTSEPALGESAVPLRGAHPA